MAAGRTTGRTNRRGEYRASGYVHGTAARQYDVKKQLAQPKKQLSRAARKNRQRAKYMNLAYVLFLSVALIVTGTVLIGYIRLESGITNSVKEISRLESQLNNLKLENDEALGRIESSVDLEQIRRIAITQLGMVYAQEGQIVEIPNDGSDYVRQYAEIQK